MENNPSPSAPPGESVTRAQAASRWSVSIQAEGDRPIELDEVVALADAVAVHGGIASGVGAMAFGAQLVIEAASSDSAANEAIALFTAAAATAGLPDWPVTRAEVIGEHEEFDIE